MKRRLKLFTLALSTPLLLSSCGIYTETDIEAAYDSGYNAGYGESYGESYDEVCNNSENSDSSYDDGFRDGYDEGFDDASTIIIDRMDPEYRAKWWDENIDDIMKYGIEY